MNEFPRRRLLQGAVFFAGLGAAGCAGVRRKPGECPFSAGTAPPGLERPEELEIVVRGSKKGGVLRKRARDVPEGLDLDAVAARMEQLMRKAGGVGIAGPQVGLSLRIVTVMLDYRTENPRVVFARNPVILERSDDCIESYEGCLSIPGVGGLVRRNRWIIVEYADSGGTSRTMRAEGPNAVLWQHEIDHLDGVLYTDRLLGELLPMEEVRRRRKQAQQRERGSALRGRPSGEIMIA